MLLKLGRPVVPGPRVRPLRLPFRCTQPGDQCQIAGWATTSSRRGKSLGSQGGAWISGKEYEGLGLLDGGEVGSLGPGRGTVWVSGLLGPGGLRGRDPGLPDAFSYQ